VAPTAVPSLDPTVPPSMSPTTSPSAKPTESPLAPTLRPTAAPTTNRVAAGSGPGSFVETKHQPLAVRGAVPEAVGGDAATFYVFIGCGVLIVLGSAICCFGIAVHFNTKKNTLRYHVHSALPRHGPPAPAMALRPPVLSNVQTMSADSMVAPFPNPMDAVTASPERDGFALDLFTAPTGSLNPILQEKAGDVEVEQNADPELDDIVSPRLNEQTPSAPDCDDEEEWELTSCSTSTAPDGIGDEIETVPQRVAPSPIDVHGSCHVTSYLNAEHI